MYAEKRPRTVHQQKKKEKSSGKLLTFCIYEYIFVYTTICGNVAAIKKAGKNMALFSMDSGVQRVCDAVTYSEIGDEIKIKE